MILRKAVEHIKGLRWVLEEMEFSSSIGRMSLLESNWLTRISDIEQALDEVSAIMGYINAAGGGISLLKLQLSEVVNISGSIETLRSHSSICSDVDLFEIKKLALLDEKIAKIACEYHYQLSERPSLAGVLRVLDPREERLPSFYIDNYFDPRLKELRQAIELATEDSEQAQLNALLADREERVREQLTHALAPFANSLAQVLNALAHDTALIAKAEWAVASGACRPTPVLSGETVLEGLFNPEVAHQLSERGKSFQPVSISFASEPTLISGANMGGKSVLLNSVALAQAMMQYGMYVPAKGATLSVVSQVLYSVGDGENTQLGLSSFGAEMLRLNRIIQCVKQREPLLAIIDEPARTTNPEEGYALVAGLVKLLERYGAKALITTHYSGVPSEGKRWRVKGLTEEGDIKGIAVDQLGQLMDYSLVPDTLESVPREAFRIARLLGVDEEYLEVSNTCFRTFE